MRFHGYRTTTTTATAHGTRRSHWPPLAGRPRVGGGRRVTSGPRLCPGPVVSPGWPRLVAGGGAAIWGRSCCLLPAKPAVLPARVLAINEVAIIFCKKMHQFFILNQSHYAVECIHFSSIFWTLFCEVLSFMMSCGEHEMR